MLLILGFGYGVPDMGYFTITERASPNRYTLEVCVLALLSSSFTEVEVTYERTDNR